jgi:hypothetical protein
MSFVFIFGRLSSLTRVLQSNETLSHPMDTDTEQCDGLSDAPCIHCRARGLTCRAGPTGVHREGAEAPQSAADIHIDQTSGNHDVIKLQIDKMEGQSSLLYGSMMGSLQDFSSLAMENARIEVALADLWVEQGRWVVNPLLFRVKELIN